MPSYTNEIKLSSFQANIGDLVRSNRFIVTFTGTNAGEIPDQHKYFIKSVQLPGRTIGPLPDLNWQGLKDKRPGDPSYEDMSLTFHNDVNFTIKKWIEEWMENIAGGVNNIRETKANTEAELVIEQLGQNSDVIATYHCYGIWPKAINALDLSYESVDSTPELTVTFSCDYWSGGPRKQMAVGDFANPTG